MGKNSVLDGCNLRMKENSGKEGNREARAGELGVWLGGWLGKEGERQCITFEIVYSNFIGGGLWRQRHGYVML